MNSPATIEGTPLMAFTIVRTSCTTRPPTSFMKTRGGDRRSARRCSIASADLLERAHDRMLAAAIGGLDCGPTDASVSLKKLPDSVW